jgi:peptidyl-prolyl cis-trans isomerase D
MFDKIRNPNKERSYKKIFAAILFGMICFSFVFLGLTPGGPEAGFQGSGAVAYVNSSVISIAEFRERLEYNERQSGAMASQGSAAERQARATEMRQRTINELVDQQIVAQAAAKEGIVAPDNAVRDQILSIPAFQDGGQFDRLRYDQYLEFSRSTPGEFENKVRRQVVDNQLRQAFFRALKNPDVLGTLESELRETKLNIEFVQFTSEQVPADKVAALEEALKAGQAPEGFMAANKLKWQETGAVDLANSSFLPNLGDHQNVVDAALELKPGQVANRVVRSGPQMFIVKLKSLSPAVAKSEASPSPFSLAPFEALNNWSRTVKEKSKIKINDAMM